MTFCRSRLLRESSVFGLRYRWPVPALGPYKESEGRESNQRIGRVAPEGAGGPRTVVHESHQKGDRLRGPECERRASILAFLAAASRTARLQLWRRSS